MKQTFSNYTQIAILLAGLVTILVCLFSEVDFKDAVPLLVALVAGFVALSINETVSSRRKAELESKLREQREQVYRDLLEHLLQSFTGVPDRPEFQVRTQIALWGSSDLLQAYSEWQSLIRPIIQPGTPVAIPLNLKTPMQEAIANVCLAARKDLGISTSPEPKVAQIADLFFDDYAPEQ